VTEELKLSIHSFHPVRVLGEGGFGRAVPARNTAVDGPDQLVAVKVLKKAIRFILLYDISVHNHGGVVVEALRYKPECCGFDSRWCHWMFSLT
jgi:hypothetical protein